MEHSNIDKNKKRLFEMMNKVNKCNLTESIDILKKEEDIIDGGLADNITSMPDQSKEQLNLGIDVEMEHTNNPNISKEIAMDHLIEDPKYYTKLQNMESGNCDEGINEEIDSDQYNELYNDVENVVKETFRDIRINENKIPVNIDTYINGNLRTLVLDVNSIEFMNNNTNQSYYNSEYNVELDLYYLKVDLPIVVTTTKSIRDEELIFENEVFFEYSKINLTLENKK